MNVADELQRLQQLHDSGAIDDAEFAAAKDRVLNPPPTNPFGFPSTPRAELTPETRERETKQWASLLHLSMLLGYTAIPIAGLVAPIIIWQVKKNDLPGLDAHGRNAVNWIISSMIYVAISIVLTFVLIGIPLLIAVLVCDFVFPILAAAKANNGEAWKYPLSIEFLKE